MSNQIEIKKCPTCNRKLKPGVIIINGKREIKLVCRYCNLEKKIKKPKESAIPKECPYCKSKNIKIDYTDKEGVDFWECQDCTSWFSWHKYIAVFCVEVKFESTSNEAKELACELLHERGEPELLGYWEEGKYDANVSLRTNKREIKENVKQND